MQSRRWGALVLALAIAGLIAWLIFDDEPPSVPSAPSAPDASIPDASTPDASVPSVPSEPDAGVAPHPTKPPSGRGLIGYGRPYRSFVGGALNRAGRVAHVIGIRDLAPDLTAQLDVLSTSGAPAVPLTGTPTAQVRTLRVSSAAPEAVAWVDGVDQSGLGTVMYADLEQKTPVASAVPNGSHAPEDALHFGANGRQLLIHAGYAAGATSGQLYWWSGTGKPTLIGERAPTVATLMSADAKVAVVGVAFDKATSLGDLLAVDMATGETTTIAQRVALTAAGYESTDRLLSFAHQPAYAMSRNGRYVAFATEDGKVTLWSRGKPPVVIGTGGRFPSPSEDGRAVAYYAGDKLVVWTAGKSVSFPAAGALTPVWSPDSHYLAFLTKYTMNGKHLLSEVQGDVSVFQLGASRPTEWAKDASWESVQFGPPAGPTTSLVAFGHLPDHPSGTVLDEGLGDVVIGPPSGSPGAAVASVRADSYRFLPRSRGVAFTAADRLHRTVTAGVWTARLPVRTDLVPDAIDSTLQAGDPSHPDDCLVLTEASGTSFGGSYVVGTLMGFVPGGRPFRVKDDALASAFTRDGRILTLTREPGSETNADVWILPFGPASPSGTPRFPK